MFCRHAQTLIARRFHGPCLSVVDNRSEFHLCFVFHSSNGRRFLLLWKWNPRGGQPGLCLKFVPVYWRSPQIRGFRRGVRVSGQSAWHCKNSQLCRCFRPVWLWNPVQIAQVFQALLKELPRKQYRDNKVGPALVYVVRSCSLKRHSLALLDTVTHDVRTQNDTATDYTSLTCALLPKKMPPAQLWLGWNRLCSLLQVIYMQT